MWDISVHKYLILLLNDEVFFIFFSFCFLFSLSVDKLVKNELRLKLFKLLSFPLLLLLILLSQIFLFSSLYIKKLLLFLDVEISIRNLIYILPILIPGPNKFSFIDLFNSSFICCSYFIFFMSFNCFNLNQAIFKFDSPIVLLFSILINVTK